MFNYLKRIAVTRTPWILLASTALMLEFAALFFQYQMKLDPCVLCVYERTAVFGIVIAGLIAALYPASILLRWFAMLLWGASASWGLFLALKHTGIQLFPSPSNTCDFAASYPAWAKLDEWFPWLFQPTGFCDEIQWQFFGYTMPQTMIGVYTVYLVVLIALLFSELFVKRRLLFRS
ncbi:disulfide bond formation protein DsbB [Sedimenticola selenatireducens]|uniref:Disulfide bond formation protein B n=1 Tax=Sedimenticola selenatireducens TaxID=191960 RepID=A0A558DQ50_9GAMM|nr:disulfide bond formation protein DsbB [Sedimenticola selenatireducens]TVO70521.1 disulfide bond formation protein DsbB [Sedimenticola selenatireducens]TVT63098.1 MAG: disulfide bond formation protein DsbB [Sedimenticola selenatireducens]